MKAPVKYKDNYIKKLIMHIKMVNVGLDKKTRCDDMTKNGMSKQGLNSFQ